MAYAVYACSKCGDRLPANQMTTVIDQVTTGTTNYQRRNHGILRQGGRSTHVANQRRRLCPRCLKKRRLFQIAAFSVVAMIAVPAIAVPVVAGGLLLALLYALRRAFPLLLIGLAVAAGAIWMMGGRPLNLVRTLRSTLSRELASSRASDVLPKGSGTARSSSAIVDREVVTRPRPTRPTFAPPRAVVQALQPAREDYPPCSSTVTDHCVGR